MTGKIGFKTWLQSLNENFDPEMRDSLLRETPHTSFRPPDLPPELAFLNGVGVDLGFEHLGKENYGPAMMAFADKGVAVPGTKWRIRFKDSLGSVVEPADGTEPVLPAHWKEAVLVWNQDWVPLWVGKRVRPDQYSNMDLAGYIDVGEALVHPSRAND